ncbi:uncharacterized protein CPUR_08844 [Claviceps purpurea 20.1]|uniref:Uncharacterized protein n=1 Tax=Claviceps purpurea (strain 20.1) TaxID=1111077 RepID=M1WIQ3_CLAP2|nr:uncharacterized protein CPUR_08818 [Claviceps purpurea 20.1]CCE34905.1 uncharacterized protein CPUR_08844 [Claviceps purpurea 20.1]
MERTAGQHDFLSRHQSSNG